MKKPIQMLLIIGLFWLILFAGWKFSTTGNDPIPPQTSAPTETLPEGEVVAEIVMGQDGYEPNTVTLKAGQALRFVNKSSGNRWPASNIHPTHELYPEFDPKKELKPGETWTFTFHNKGTWRMHDHLFSYMKGIVTVTE